MKIQRQSQKKVKFAMIYLIVQQCYDCKILRDVIYGKRKKYNYEKTSILSYIMVYQNPTPTIRLGGPATLKRNWRFLSGIDQSPLDSLSLVNHKKLELLLCLVFCTFTRVKQASRIFWTWLIFCRILEITRNLKNYCVNGWLIIFSINIKKVKWFFKTHPTVQLVTMSAL